MKKQMEWQDIKKICLKHKIDYEDLYNTKNRSKFSNSYVKVKSLINLRKNISRRNQFNFDFSYNVIEKQILNLFKK